MRSLKRASDVQALLLQNPTLYESKSGALSLVVSICLTRGVRRVREDVDDPETPLISRCGHCSQELVNLVLLGMGVSNVFDGDRWLGDDLSSGVQLHGVTLREPVQ